MSNFYQPPPGGGQQPPRPMGGPMGYGPPGSTSPAAGAQQPPGGGFGQPFGRPPATGGNFPPPSGMGGGPGMGGGMGMGGGGPPMSQAPRGGGPPATGGAGMQFYSTASGAPRPATNLAGGPPASQMGGGMGGMPPPPSNMGGGGGMGPGPSPPPGGQFGPPGGGMGGMSPPGQGQGQPPGGFGGPPGGGGMGGGYPQSTHPGMGGAGPGGGNNPYGTSDNSGGGMMGGGGGYQGQGGPQMMTAPGISPGPGMHQGFGNPSGMGGPGAPQGNMGMDGNNQQGGGNPGGELPALDDMDTSIECNPKYMRASISKIINSRDMLVASKLPVGVMCQPMPRTASENDAQSGANDPIEVVDFGSTGIVRCKRCRAYINPYVTWNDNGRRWRCNLCGMLNDVPSSYFSHLDQNGQRRDKLQRPELCNASVEFIASGDYMVRPPQPPVYFFVIDVSCISNQSGMLQSVVNSVKAALDDIPGKPRAQIGFMTFDSTIHYYSLKSTLKAPQMLVVSDLSDGVQPLPEDLLVNIEESRDIILTLLDSLPHMFSGNNSSNNNMASINTCTGPALMSAKKIIQHVGGKLLLFQTTLPSIGEGTLKPRENPRLLGTDKEHMMLNAEDPWYRNAAVEFSRLQIAVDTFIFSAQYTDVATIATLSKYSAGSTYYYPGFDARRDGVRFEHDLTHNLTRNTGFEAVFRIRATRGVHVNQFYGNHTIRGSDLLALPNVTADSVFGCELTIEDAMLHAQVITVQSALLYTNAAGERRICLHTMIIPTCTNIHDMLETVDMDCTLNVMTKQSTDLAQKVGFDQGRSRVHGIAVGVLQAAQGKLSSRMPGQMGGPGYGQMGAQQQQQQERPIPDSLKLLPLYAMALQKSLALRGGQDVRVDERAYYHNLAYNMNVDDSKVFIYPRMFSIHDMEPEMGLPVDNNELINDPSIQFAGPDNIKLPNILNLSHDRLDSNGIILLDNGHDMFMWIGRNVNPALLTNIFGIASIDGSVDLALLEIQADSCDFAHRLNCVISALRSKRHRYMQLTFMREGDGYSDAFFSRYLVEDRANFPGGSISYAEYYGAVTRPSAGYQG